MPGRTEAGAEAIAGRAPANRRAGALDLVREQRADLRRRVRGGEVALADAEARAVVLGQVDAVQARVLAARRG